MKCAICTRILDERTITTVNDLQKRNFEHTSTLIGQFFPSTATFTREEVLTVQGRLGVHFDAKTSKI
jgi:hypothetical protein